MINITENQYRKIIGELGAKLGEGSYYSGIIDGMFDDNIKYSFQVSIVIYRDDFGNIAELIPVWWEFHTFMGEDEILNNFLFSEMVKHS